VAQHSRHPNQFVEEFRSPSDKAFIKQFAVFAKNFGGISKINVVENGDEPELAHDRQKRSITRAPPKGPAETPQIPTAL
jgi:hypothetical protein